MAIAFDAASNSAAQTTATTYSWAHTCTGANRLLVVSVGQRTTAGNTVSGVTYNGVALTQATAINSSTRRADLWYLVNPPAGTFTVAVTLSLAPTVSAGMAVSLTGVDQTTPLDATGTATGATAGDSVSVTTVADNSWVVDCTLSGSGTTTAYTTNQTSRSAIVLGGGFFADQSSKGPVTPAGATTMTGTSAGSGFTWAHVAASFKPVATTTPVDLGTVTANTLFASTASVTSAVNAGTATAAAVFTATGAVLAAAVVAGTANAVFSTATAVAAPTVITPAAATSVYGSSAVVTTPGSVTASSRLPLVGVGT